MTLPLAGNFPASWCHSLVVAAMVLKFLLRPVLASFGNHYSVELLVRFELLNRHWHVFGGFIFLICSVSCILMIAWVPIMSELYCGVFAQT